VSGNRDSSFYTRISTVYVKWRLVASVGPEQIYSVVGDLAKIGKFYRYPTDEIGMVRYSFIVQYR